MPADIFNSNTIRSILTRYRIQPRRERGQHFLVRRDVQAAIIRAAELPAEAIVLEIGPGLGALTEALAAATKRLVAVELDRRLAKFLQGRFRNDPNVEVVQDDIRTANLPGLGLTDLGYDLVANLPYQITSLVLRNFLGQAPRPRRLTLVIQREVAERLVAPVGEKSLLAISVEFFGAVRLQSVIPGEAFWPKPEVESALVTIDRVPLRKGLDEATFFRIVRAGFSSRRKQLHNSLAGGLGLPRSDVAEILEKAQINPSIRPQDLEFDDWVRAVKVFFDRR